MRPLIHEILENIIISTHNSFLNVCSYYQYWRKKDPIWIAIQPWYSVTNDKYEQGISILTTYLQSPCHSQHPDCYQKLPWSTGLWQRKITIMCGFFSGNEHNVCLKSEIKNTNYYLYISLCLLPDANAFLSMRNGFPAKAPLEKERIQNWHYHDSSNLSTFSMTFILQDRSFDYIHKLKSKYSSIIWFWVN